MKKHFFIGLTLFTMILSCKCKKSLPENNEKKEVIATNYSLAPIKVESVESIQNDKQEKQTQVQYTATSRGYHLEIIWANSLLSYTSQRNPGEITKVSLTKAQINELNELTKTISLERLATLKAPSQKRYHDGAPHASLKVITTSTEYQSAEFDHGNPPFEIEKLVKKLVSYIELK